MSAFHVGDRHINTLLCIADQWGVISRSYRDDFSDNYLAEWGRDFSKANDDSVNYRYKCNDKYPYEFKRVNVDNLTPVEVIKFCQCLDYQCCEVSTWEESHLKTILDGIQSQAIRKLPGYEDAPWCLD